MINIATKARRVSRINKLRLQHKKPEVDETVSPVFAYGVWCGEIEWIWLIEETISGSPKTTFCMHKWFKENIPCSNYGSNPQPLIHILGESVIMKTRYRMSKESIIRRNLDSSLVRIYFVTYQRIIYYNLF